ncbi:MAG: ABC transporter substrate-binding protein [Collimonas pratensis]|uniref:ABC transporter substrate-binding protein n=1 Tax=Collimonas pratensis TaxID=279113 RepID=UPI003C72EAC7
MADFIEIVVNGEDMPFFFKPASHAAQAPKLAKSTCLLNLMRVTVAILIVVLFAANAHADGDPILIGQSAVLTGPFTPNSLAFISGQTLFFNKFNAVGGLNGHPIKVITYDDAYLGDRAAANTERLIKQDHVICLFGTMGTAIGAAMTKVAMEHHSFIFGGLTGAEILRDTKLPVYHIRASYADEARRTMTHLRIIGQTRVAVISSDDAYGKGIEEVTLRALSDGGNPAVISLRFDPKQDNLRDIAERVTKSNAQAVYVIAAGLPAINVIRALSVLPSHPPIYTNSVGSSFLLYKELGDKSRGIVLSQVMPPFWQTRLRITKEYQQALQSAGQQNQASYMSLEGYITAKVFTEMLRRVPGSVTTESLRHAIENSGPVDVGDFNLSFSPSKKSGSDFVDITFLSGGGKFVQ